MARKRFTEDQIAQILVEAAYRGDREVADKYKIGQRTLYRWRDLAENSPSLAKLIKQKKLALERGWADEAASALKASLEYLKEAAQKADKTDPAAIHAVAGVAKIVSELLVTREVLDARLSGQDREDNTQD